MTGRQPRLGPLTEVSSLRQATEQFQRISPDLPRIAETGNQLPRHREKAAERHRQRGSRLLKAGRPGLAIAAFGEAIRLDPRNADAHHALGCALLQVGRAEDAIENLRLATVLQDDAAAYRSLAAALRRCHYKVKVPKTVEIFYAGPIVGLTDNFTKMVHRQNLSDL